MLIQEIGQSLEKLRNYKPLIHNITNVVVTNFTANGLLALGASPVMAYAREEVAEMASRAGAVVLNLGTLTQERAESMILAGNAANEAGIPVLFDPVGVGALTYRTQTADKITKEIRLTTIRGNAAEIANLIGEGWEIKGVDAGLISGNVVELAKRAANQLKCCVVITGKDDVVSDGRLLYVVQNGHPMLTQVTGAGCLLTSIIGAFSAVEKNILFAAVAALVTYGVAAEIAANRKAEEGPGSFQVELLNQLAKVSSEDLLQYARIEQKIDK